MLLTPLFSMFHLVYIITTTVTQSEKNLMVQNCSVYHLKGPSFHDISGQDKVPFQTPKSIYLSPIFKKKSPENKKLLFLLGFRSHQHCKGYMATFQLYWWKKTSSFPSCIISDRSRHLSRTTNIL